MRYHLPDEPVTDRNHLQNIVITTIRNRENQFIYAEGAVERIMERAPLGVRTEAMIKWLEAAIRAEEIGRRDGEPLLAILPDALTGYVP